MSNPKDTRICIACRTHSDKSEMLRIVRKPDGEIALDKTQKADGRGVYIHCDEQCIAKAVRRKLLNGAFKCSVSEAVYEQIKIK